MPVKVARMLSLRDPIPTRSQLLSDGKQNLRVFIPRFADDGEKPPQLPNLLKGKSSDDLVWGGKGRDAIYLHKLRKCLIDLFLTWWGSKRIRHRDRTVQRQSGIVIMTIRHATFTQSAEGA
jgi:hypothetical protein